MSLLGTLPTLAGCRVKVRLPAYCRRSGLNVGYRRNQKPWIIMISDWFGTMARSVARAGLIRPDPYRVSSAGRGSRDHRSRIMSVGNFRVILSIVSVSEMPHDGSNSTIKGAPRFIISMSSFLRTM